MFTGVTRMLAISDLWHSAAAFHPVFVGKCRQEISGFILGDLPWQWPVVVWTVATVCMIPWARRAGHVTDAALSPLGGLMILMAAVWGVISRALGIGIQWKGRRV